jgi:hypothetical protein
MQRLILRKTTQIGILKHVRNIHFFFLQHGLGTVYFITHYFISAVEETVGFQIEGTAFNEL